MPNPEHRRHPQFARCDREATLGSELLFSALASAARSDPFIVLRLGIASWRSLAEPQSGQAQVSDALRISCHASNNPQFLHS